MTNNELQSDPDPSFTPVPAAHGARIKLLVDSKNSLDRVAKILKVSPLTVSKVIGGQSVSRGTRALIAAKIAERDAAGKRP